MEDLMAEDSDSTGPVVQVLGNSDDEEEEVVPILDSDSDDSVSMLRFEANVRAGMRTPTLASIHRAMAEALERPRAPSPHTPPFIEASETESDSESIGPSREPSGPSSRASSRASTPQLPSRRPRAATGETVRMEINLNPNQENTDSDGDIDSDSDAAMTRPASEMSNDGSTDRPGSPNMEAEPSCAAGSAASLGPSTSASSGQTDSARPSTSADNDDEDEGACCPICFETWTNSGSHRLASLKCGHLFGQSCIQKWIKGRKGKCPQCNAKAARSDIRVLYAKAIKMVDTTEHEAARKELEKEKDARRKAELAAAEARLRFQMALDQVKRMEEECEKQKQQLSLMRSHGQSSGLPHTSSPAKVSQPAAINTPLFEFEKSMKISETGNCRVMAYSTQLATLCVSQPSTNSLFPGYGVKKLSSLDFRTTQYVSIHTKPIRDLAFNSASPDGLLLSASMDATVRMTSLMSNTVVQIYRCSTPVWSCAWDLDNWNYFYAGQQNGTVCVFDTRNTSEHVQQLSVSGSKSPAVAVQYVSKNPQSSFSPGGLLLGQLDKATFFERQNGEEYKPHRFPLEGSLTSLSVSNETRHLLATYRPTSRHPSVRHQMCRLTCENLSTPSQEVDHMCCCSTVKTFQGGSTQKLLGRSKLVPHPNQPEKLFVCAGDEASLSAHVWDVSTGQLRQKLSTNSPVIDICSFSASGDRGLLTTLTEKQINIYKWR